MLSASLPTTFRIGAIDFAPEIVEGELRSIGAPRFRDTLLRNPGTRFLPWFDAYEGEVFRRFRFQELTTRGDETILHTRAISDPDVMFRERRDSSGDLVFRAQGWDAEPVEVDVRIVLAPTESVIDGRTFTGFRYWFEYESDTLAIHRFLDRQTWEIGGNLDHVNICLRNWSHAPMMQLAKDQFFSSGGLVTSFCVAFPGNLWGRWSLIPPFDYQYGAHGTLVSWFDQVSLIRTLIESGEGEDYLRCLDMHYFENTKRVTTNPKTVLFNPDPLDDVAAANLWTRVYDQEHDKACANLGMQEEEPPQIILCQNCWVGHHFDHSYEHTMDVAEEFGADYIFIDPIWQNEQSLLEQFNNLIPEDVRANTELGKYLFTNMCCTLDFEVSQYRGGEERLKALVDRAAGKGLKVISWLATHTGPRTMIAHYESRNTNGHGNGGIFATKESGYHPDTGYAADCWPLNLNAPIYERLREQVLGVCQRTGLNGFLWDSFSNLGWWQIDYSNGSMRPQYDKMAQLYTDLVNQGCYMRPEALVAFSNHSGLGMAGGNYYPAGILATYSYNSEISMEEGEEQEFMRGKVPFDMFFQWVANRHMPSMQFQRLPREQWDAQRVAEVKELFKVYKTHRHLMKTRTILPDIAGVYWENGVDQQALLFSFVDRPWSEPATDAATGEAVTDGMLKKNRAYLVAPGSI